MKRALRYENLRPALLALAYAGWHTAHRSLAHAENWIENRVPLASLGDCREIIRYVCSQNQLKVPYHDPEVVIRELLPKAFEAVELERQSQNPTADLPPTSLGSDYPGATATVNLTKRPSPGRKK